MRKVFVVGASSSIGLAVCHKFLKNNWSVLAHYNRNQSALNKLAANSHGRLESIHLCFDNPYDLEDRLSEVRDRYIHCDALINCAARLEPHDFKQLSVENIFLHISTNLVPGLLLMRDLGPSMMSRGWGRIVHLGSIGVKFGGGQNSFSYALSKHALEMLPQECRVWSRKNVLVNTLRVGVTDTIIHSLDKKKNVAERISLIPMRRMAQPEEIAASVWFLGSEENSYITGQVISISGGE